MRKALVPLLLAGVTALLYLPRLGDAPIYLMPDEVHVGVQAHSIATTGRDAFQGRLLPVFFEYNRLIVEHNGDRSIRNSWLPPAIFYAVATVLQVLPLSETAIRLPTAIVGIVNVLLMYFIGLRLFHNNWLAVACSALLALTPSHLIHSRMAADYLFPVAFMLGWLLCLLIHVETGRKRMLVAAALCLGVGLYSYAASPVVMPVYVLMTFAVLLHQRRPAGAYVIVALTLLLLALPGIWWLVAHPNMLTDVVAKYDLKDPSALTPLQGLRALFTYHRIGDQLGLYWAFFNPRFLFFDGPMEPMFSTRQVGVFLLSVGPLLAAGLIATLRQPFSVPALLLLAGFATAPMAATLVNVNDAIYRALEMLPFVVLLAVAGMKFLWEMERSTPRRGMLLLLGVGVVLLGGSYGAVVLATQSRLPGAAVPLMLLGAMTIVLGLFANRLRLGQAIVIALLAIVPIQFAYFYVDYFSDYRRRTAFVFSGNIRGAFEEALRQDRELPAPTIYLGEVGPYSMGPLYWKFYLTKHGRPDLLERTIDAYLFYPDEVRKLPARSLVVTNAGDGAADAVIETLVAAGEWKKTVIKEPDGTPSYFVLRRTTGA